MLNYEIDPALLAPRVPHGTEIDAWNGRCFVSMVGFLFLDTRVRGLAIPFHRNFEEVNLRFYVKRRAQDGLRRAVVFVKEIVPRAAIAWTARTLYNENYISLPMGHEILHGGDPQVPRSVSYKWRFRGRDQRLMVEPSSCYRPLISGSHEEFIAEHYWGYSSLRNGDTIEYRVEHPSWRIASIASAELQCDAASLYGEAFADPLGAEPHSALLAEGSEVAVEKGTRLAL